jgi:hypothetical protein
VYKLLCRLIFSQERPFLRMKGEHMSEIKSNLYPCQHCGETGTCTSGEDGAGCAVCMKKNELRKSASSIGISCGSCGGLGKAEPMTERMNNRLPAILSIVIFGCLITFSFILAVYENKYFPEYLAFSGTLLGGIVTFYFTSRK